MEGLSRRLMASANSRALGVQKIQDFCVCVSGLVGPRVWG